MVFWRHFQQYFSYIVAVTFIGGGNRSTRRKPPTCRKSLTNFSTKVWRNQGVIRSRKSKDRQYNGRTKKDNRTNNDLQTNTEKPKERATKPGNTTKNRGRGEIRCSGTVLNSSWLYRCKMYWSIPFLDNDLSWTKHNYLRHYSHITNKLLNELVLIVSQTC
jgi:hypothetical protein